MCEGCRRDASSARSRGDTVKQTRAASLVCARLDYQMRPSTSVQTPCAMRISGHTLHLSVLTVTRCCQNGLDGCTNLCAHSIFHPHSPRRRTPSPVASLAGRRGEAPLIRTLLITETVSVTPSTSLPYVSVSRSRTPWISWTIGYYVQLDPSGRSSSFAASPPSWTYVEGRRHPLTDCEPACIKLLSEQRRE